MATTKESFQDALRWVFDALMIGLRRAVVIGILAGLFALLVIVTTRERQSNCGDVTDEQRALVAALHDPAADRSFRAIEPARCADGMYSASIVGLADDMEAATEQLEAEGWLLDTNYIGYYQQLWRRCFRRVEPGWERVQITVDATRGGSAHTVKVTAPERVDACDLERRETSEIFPP